jgi:hypothetical protein
MDETVVNLRTGHAGRARLPWQAECTGRSEAGVQPVQTVQTVQPVQTGRIERPPRRFVPMFPLSGCLCLSLCAPRAGGASALSSRTLAAHTTVVASGPPAPSFAHHSAHIWAGIRGPTRRGHGRAMAPRAVTPSATHLDAVVAAVQSAHASSRRRPARRRECNSSTVLVPARSGAAQRLLQPMNEEKVFTAAKPKSHCDATAVRSANHDLRNHPERTRLAPDK